MVLGLPIQRAAASPAILVVCTRGGHRRSKIATMEREGPPFAAFGQPEEDARAAEHARWYDAHLIRRRREQNSDGTWSTVHRLRRDDSSRQLVGDEVSEPAWFEEQPAAGETRLTHTFRCKECGYSPTLQGERVDPVLDRLAEHEVAEIELERLVSLCLRGAGR